MPTNPKKPQEVVLIQDKIKRKYKFLGSISAAAVNKYVWPMSGGTYPTEKHINAILQKKLPPLVLMQ